jgi:hypothetical protein
MDVIPRLVVAVGVLVAIGAVFVLARWLRRSEKGERTLVSLNGRE